MFNINHIINRLPADYTTQHTSLRSTEQIVNKKINKDNLNIQMLRQFNQMERLIFELRPPKYIYDIYK